MSFRNATLLILPLLALAISPACTDEPGTDAEAGDGDAEAGDGDGDGDTGLAGLCDPNIMTGNFIVQMELDYTAFSGSVSDSVVDSKVLQLVETEGDCKLVRKDNSFCEPLCASDEVCDLSGTCVPAPIAQNLGTLTLTGTKPDLTVEPTGSNKYNGIPEHPGFDPGANIRLRTAGGVTDPLDLRGGGFEPVVEQTQPWEIEAGKPIQVSWTPSAEIGPYDPYVRILLNIDQHGSTPMTLICDVADTGATEIPVTLIDTLINSGVSGFPSGHIYRRTSDSAQTEWGCAQFTVESHAQALIDIVGHTPCQSDPDCPDPQICDIPNETCVDP